MLMQFVVEAPSIGIVVPTLLLKVGSLHVGGLMHVWGLTETSNSVHHSVHLWVQLAHHQRFVHEISGVSFHHLVWPLKF